MEISLDWFIAFFMFFLLEILHQNGRLSPLSERMIRWMRMVACCFISISVPKIKGNSKMRFRFFRQNRKHIDKQKKDVML
jgi:hypothetical protein